MFGRKKKDKFYVELNPAEVKIFVTALINFRNKCMALGKPTEDINDLLLMLNKWKTGRGMLNSAALLLGILKTENT